MPNATSTRRTRPVDASSAPAASRLAPMRVRALRQLNRVVRPLARRCYVMPQPKKRSLSGTKNAALASHVKAARVRSAAAAGASSSAQPIVEMDAGAGARCIEMPHGHRSRTFAHARKLSLAGGRGSDRVRSAAAAGVIVGRADRGDGYGSGCVMHRNAAQPSLACVCSRTQVVSRRRSWFRAAAAAAEANRSCSKGAARPAHGRAMVDVGRVRDVGRGRPRPLSCRARARIAWRAAPGAGTTGRARTGRGPGRRGPCGRHGGRWSPIDQVHNPPRN